MRLRFVALAVSVFAFAAAPAFAVSQYYVWQDLNGDNVKDVVVGTITAYSGALSAFDNAGYYSASMHPVNGPAPEAYKSKIFLYQDGSGNLSFNMVHNIDMGGNQYWNHVVWDLTVAGTPSSLVLSDDAGGAPGEFKSTAPGVYWGNWAYINNTDGGVIGGLSGGNWEIMIDPSQFGDIQTWDAYSGDGSSVNLWMNPTAPPTGLGNTDHYRLGTDAHTTFITPVPEPGTLLLLGMGLAGLGAARRRRR